MIKPIGDGAMGQLFRAIRTGATFAIKILPEAFSHDADRDAEFLAPEKDLAFQPMIPAGSERSQTSSGATNAAHRDKRIARLRLYHAVRNRTPLDAAALVIEYDEAHSRVDAVHS